ncbi:MAG TPA: hypothetical protein DGB85_09420 [Deltaproteobacteria bacterium]|nr:hypothetical protein [Deltaproteobacteria bacterium]
MDYGLILVNPSLIKRDKLVGVIWLIGKQGLLRETPQASANWACVQGRAKRYSRSHWLRDGLQKKSGLRSTNEIGAGIEASPT